MKELNPKVSIVIPVYNGSNFMGEAIDSALAQTYKNIEIVVVNDGSTDDGATDKIARSYGDKIRYFEKKNGGVATALNYGIQKMTGSYFSWLSHDDMYEKTKIEEEVKLLNETEGSEIIVACNAKVLFPNGMKKNEYIDKATFEFIDIFLATSAVVGVNGCSLLIPKKAIIDCAGFDVNLPVTQDYDLWFKLKDKCKFVLLEKNLVISRRHEGQDSVKKQKMCFDAGEVMHYDFLSNIEYTRFEQFFNANQNNISSYWDNYIAYKLNGYKVTASMMLRNLLRYYFENDIDKFKEVCSSEIGSVVNPAFMSKEKTKKRLLFYSNVWHKGGIEKVLSIMLEHFSDKYDCILVINDDNNESNTGYQLPASVSYVKINSKNQNVDLMNLVYVFDVDLFIGNPNISEKFLDIYSLLKETNVKSIAYNHGYYFLPYMYEHLYPAAVKTKDAYASADFVIWLTQIACNIYNIENDNGVFIPNPALTSAVNQPKKTVNKNVLAVGRFDDEIKQIDKTLLVFKELHKIDPDYHLDVVGDCPIDTELPWLGNMSLNDYMTEQEIPIDNIKFWGEQDDVTKFYNEASFLIMTSRCEGFGMVFLEALAKGVPCASFGYLGIEEIIQDGHNGLVRDQDDYIGLAKSIDSTVENKRQYFEMSQNSTMSVRQFDVKNYYDKWEKLIELALAEETNSKHTDLQPDKKLTIDDYRKISLEYEEVLKDVAKNYIDLYQETLPKQEKPKPINKINKIKIRFKESIDRDGVYLTGEKIIRKIHRKITRR